MYFGTQYYRPPFPNEKDWERDMKNIYELGFNTIKLWAVWNDIEKEEGVYDYSSLDRLIEIAGGYDLHVIINIIPEGAPYRLYEEHPDCLYESVTGFKVTMGGPANIPTGGWPGLCMDNKEIEDKVCNFIFNTARHFSLNNTVKIIDVWNEPHMEPTFDYPDEMFCACKGSVEAFRTWVMHKYQSLNALNEAWHRNYTSFNQVVPPPRFGTYTDMMDWRKFWLHNVAVWLRKRVSAARRGAPNKTIQTHSASADYMGASSTGALGRELSDEFLLAKEVDIFGLSSFPKWLMGNTPKEYHLSHLLQSEIICAASREKDFYQVEQQGGGGVPGYLAHKQPTKEDIRMWNWNTIAAGGKGVVYWQYAPEPSGCESPGFGLTDCDGGNTPRSLEAGRMARTFMQYKLDEKSPELAVNGIYLSRNSDLLLFAANSQEEKYSHSIYGVYQAFVREGIPVRFVHEDYLDQVSKEGLENLYVPMALALSEKETTELLQFAKDGGKVFVEAGTGMYSDIGDSYNGSQLLRRVFNGSGFDMNRVDHTVEIYDKQKNLILKGADYIQTFRTFDGTIKAVNKQGDFAIREQDFGKGKVIWIGTFAGLFAYDDNDILCSFIRKNFNTCGYLRFDHLEAKDLIVRCLKDNQECFVIAINQSEQPKNMRIQLKNDAMQEFTVNPLDGIILNVK